MGDYFENINLTKTWDLFCGIDGRLSKGSVMGIV
jgi:hypothetical protein